MIRRAASLLGVAACVLLAWLGGEGSAGATPAGWVSAVTDTQWAFPSFQVTGPGVVAVPVSADHAAVVCVTGVPGARCLETPQYATAQSNPTPYRFAVADGDVATVTASDRGLFDAAGNPPAGQTTADFQPWIVDPHDVWTASTGPTVTATATATTTATATVAAAGEPCPVSAPTAWDGQLTAGTGAGCDLGTATTVQVASTDRLRTAVVIAGSVMTFVLTALLVVSVKA